MLTEIRDRATGIVAIFIIFLISLTFATWGIQEYFSGADEVVVAEVNGDEIEQQLYRNAVRNQREALRRSLGRRASTDFLNSPEFRRRILDQLVDEMLLIQYAVDYSYRISDAQLRTYIESQKLFQENGQFAQGLYQNALRNAGLSVTQYEEQLRQQNVVDQIRNGFIESVFVTDSELNSVLSLYAQKRNFSVVQVASGRFEPRVKISDDEIKAEYEKQPDRYRNPEQLKVQYISLSVDDLAKQSDPSEEEVRAYYESNIHQFVDPAKRHASHILLTVARAANEDVVKQVREKAQAISIQARAGADFAKLAKANSQDSGSAKKGGDLGLVSRGVMVKPFEQALFAMTEAGQVSEPVRSQFGFHIIKLTKLVPKKVEPLEKVRKDVLAEMRQRYAENEFAERAETFRNVVYEQPESLQPAADELGLEVQSSDWFTRDKGTGIMADAKLRQLAFGEEVFLEGQNGEATELNEGTLVAIRKLDHREASMKPLEEVKTSIVTRLKREKADALTREFGQKIIKRLTKGEDWNALLKMEKLEPKTYSGSRKDLTGLSREVVAEVFRTSPADDSKTAYGGTEIGSSRYGIFRLEKVVNVDTDSVDGATRKKLKQAIRNRRGAEFYQAYRQGLRELAEIEVFEDRL